MGATAVRRTVRMVRVNRSVPLARDKCCRVEDLIATLAARAVLSEREAKSAPVGESAR